MNQIIYNSSNNLNCSTNNFKKRNLFKFFFMILIVLSCFLFIYYLFFRYDLYQHEKISQKLLDNYNITTLYPTVANYTTSKLNKKEVSKDLNNISSSVIGIIEIKKLNIVYPILSEINKEYLKISPCKFYGPNPNKVRKSLYCSSQL